MKRSSAGSKKPLEWVFGRVATTNATVTNYRIELGLKDDEVAEIHKIDSSIGLANIPDTTNDDVDVAMMLSMDPDVVVSPLVPANHDDLEVFYEHRLHVQQEVGAAGTAALKDSENRISDFKPPVLVGTDVGMSVIGDAAIAVDFWVRLYFTRRKANVMELNQILLKRR